MFNNVLIQYPGDYLNDGFGDYGTGPNWSIYNNSFLGSGDVRNSGCIVLGAMASIVKNNIFSGCTTFISAPSGAFAPGGLNNNLYANAVPGGNPPWDYNSVAINALADWQSATGQDANSTHVASADLDSTGKPLAGSPAIGVGANLTSVGIASLDSDYGGISRPGSGPWDAGAYQYSSTPINDTQAPSVPSGLATTSVISSSVSLQWSASTDNSAVAGYKIYRNGSLLTSTSNTSYTDSSVS